MKLWIKPNIKLSEACTSSKKKEAKNFSFSFLKSRLSVELMSYLCHNTKSEFTIMSEED